MRKDTCRCSVSAPHLAPGAALLMQAAAPLAQPLLVPLCPPGLQGPCRGAAPGGELRAQPLGSSWGPAKSRSTPHPARPRPSSCCPSSWLRTSELALLPSPGKSLAPHHLLQERGDRAAVSACLKTERQPRPPGRAVSRKQANKSPLLVYTLLQPRRHS